MGTHAGGHRRQERRWGAKRFLIPAVAGVVTFGAVTAFAATLSVTSKSLGAGNATVASCNATAQVTYTTSYLQSLPGYIVATTPISTGSTCNGMSFKVTLMGSTNNALAEQTGTLDATGAATPNFTASGISAQLVTGVAVAITG